MKGQPANWGKAWIRVALDPVTKEDGTLIDNNVLFVHITLNYDKSSKKHKHTTALVENLKEGSFISVREAKIEKIKRSRKNDDGDWENYFETGIRAHPDQIKFSSSRIPGFNQGTVAGKVSKQKGLATIVEEPYMVPGKEVEWRVREIPLVLPPSSGGEILGKYIVCTAQLSGIGPSGNYSVCGYIKDILIEP
jgi:hypothetical protein